MRHRVRTQSSVRLLRNCFRRWASGFSPHRKEPGRTLSTCRSMLERHGNGGARVGPAARNAVTTVTRRAEIGHAASNEPDRDMRPFRQTPGRHEGCKTLHPEPMLAQVAPPCWR